MAGSAAAVNLLRTWAHTVAGNYAGSKQIAGIELAESRQQAVSRRQAVSKASLYTCILA